MSTTTSPEQVARARWAFAFLCSGVVLAIESFFYGGFGTSGETVLRSVTTAITVVCVAFLAVGLVQLWRVASGASFPAKIATALLTMAVVAGAAGVVAIFLPGSGGLSWVGLLAPPLIIASGVSATVGAADFAGGPRRPRAEPGRSRSLLITVLGIGMLALIAVGAAELLVWMPQTLAPDFELGEIYAALNETERALGIASVVVWAVFWALMTLAAAIVTAAVSRRMEVRGRTIAVGCLLLAGSLLFFQAWAGFGLGMNISDTLPPGVGGTSTVGYVLAIIGELSLASGVFLLLAPRRPAARPAIVSV